MIPVINNRRRGTSDLVTKILLAGILCVLVALMFILLSNNRQHSQEGQTSSSDHNSLNAPDAANTQNAQNTQDGQKEYVVRPGESVSRPPEVPAPPNPQHSQNSEVSQTNRSDQNASNTPNAPSVANTANTANTATSPTSSSRKNIPNSNNSQQKYVVRPGERVSRPPEVPPPPPMIGRPERIRDVLQEGKTYEVITTAELTGPVRTEEWGFETTVYLAYRAEMQMRRTIEKNDGRRVVEFREIVNCRMVKATSRVQLRFVPTEPGALLLGALDKLLTEGQLTVLLADITKPIFRLLESEKQKTIDDLNTKMTGMIDSLSGKKVRIVFEDGKGVVELQPIDCSLTEEERDLLFASAVLTDAYLLPDEDSKPGNVWDVDGAAFADLLPPSWRSIPRGKVSIERKDDFEDKGKKYAQLECYYGTITINATDKSRSRVGTLTPRGTLKYNITDGHIETIDLQAEASIEEASRDHLLFKTRFEGAPTVSLTGSCRIINPR